MNTDRIIDWLDNVSQIKWTYGKELCDIGHSRAFNLRGTLCDYYLSNNKKKWSDYLRKDIDLLDFRIKYDKYIETKHLDITYLIKDALAWFDIDENFFVPVEHLTKTAAHEEFLLCSFLLQEHYKLPRRLEK